MEKNFEKQPFRHHREERSKVGFAILLLLAGITLLAFNVGWIPIQYKAIVLSWQMLLIALGILSFFKRHFVGGIILLSVGIFFILPVIGRSFPELGVCSTISLHTYWPILLILAGVFVLLGKTCCKRKRRWKNEGFGRYKADLNLHNSADIIDKNVMFNSSEQIVFSNNFKGGELNVMFGEINLDLRKIAKVDADNMLEVNTVFGSTLIYVPNGWQVNMKTNSVFANIQDKRIEQNGIQTGENSMEKVVLNLKCSCVFGNIEIRS